MDQYKPGSVEEEKTEAHVFYVLIWRVIFYLFELVYIYQAITSFYQSENDLYLYKNYKKTLEYVMKIISYVY